MTTDRRVEPFIVVLPLRLVSEANARQHWSKRAKRAREQRSLALMSLYTGLRARGWVGASIGFATVTLHRVGKKMLDSDNLQRSAKAVRDGVADALGVNDADPRVAWKYTQGVGPRYEVRIEVSAVRR